jgi:hypothetical protein
MTLKLEAGKSYRTRDGRNTGPLLADRHKFIAKDIPCAMNRRGQVYFSDGAVFCESRGEENDTIVAEWQSVTVGAKYYGSTGEVKVEAVANDWIVYSHSESCTKVCRTETFLAAYQPERPTKTVWVNLWWKNGAYVDIGATHYTEESARATGNGPEAVYIKTISLEVPA